MVEQLRMELGQRGELVIIVETMPSREFHRLQPSTRELALLNSLAQRNSARGLISDIQLPLKTRLRATDSITKPLAKGTSFFDDVNWDSFAKEFPHGMLLRLSLPAFSEDGTKAIICYWASGGFDDSRGAYLIFEKKQGRWVVVDYLGAWIT